MKLVYILFVMIFAHIVDDYYLQGILAKLKQKKWWEENAPAKLYEYDYLMALAIHAFSWSFMITVPLLLCTDNYQALCLAIIVNAVIHAIIDHMKANLYKINLITDQLSHILQITITWSIITLMAL